MPSLNPGWRDAIKVDAHVHGLPNRPGGYLPEIRSASEYKNIGSGWGIRDYPEKTFFATGIKDSRTAGIIAKAFYTKTKFTRDYFVSLLTDEEQRTVRNNENPEAYLRLLAVTKYLSVYEDCDWAYTPHDGVPAVSKEQYVNPGFRTIWIELDTRISSGGVITPSGLVASVTEPVYITTPAAPVSQQQLLLLL